jgi:predicted metalloprotease with PDZ domain
VDSANVAPALRLTATGDGFGSSDHASFYAKNMPVLHFFSGTHADYHRASDDVERINAGGEARIVNLAHRVVRTIADRSSRLTFTRAAERTTSRSTGGKGAYFGSIPDMAAGDGSGLRLSGVRGGSPADKAGVKADDIVVEFGGKAVKDLYDYTDAIGTYAPGDTISVVVVRNGQRVPLTVVLGKRGS